MKMVFRFTLIGILVGLYNNSAVSHIVDPNPVRPTARVYWDQPFGSGPGSINVATSISFHIGFHDPNDPFETHAHPGEYFMNHVIEKPDGSTPVFSYYYDSFHLDAYDPTAAFHAGPSSWSISGCMKGFGQSHGWLDNRTIRSVAVRCRKMKAQGVKCGDCTETSIDAWNAQDVFDELRGIVAIAKQLNPDITGAVNRNGEIFLAYNNVLNEAIDFPVHVLSEVTDVLAVPAAPSVRKQKGTITTSWGTLKKG